MSDKPLLILIVVPQKFPIGQLVITPGARDALSHHDIALGLNSHVAGQWGDLCDEDCRANDKALVEGTRLLSAYESENGFRFYVITEWDRSYTTILLPEEY